VWTGSLSFMTCRLGRGGTVYSTYCTGCWGGVHGHGVVQPID